MRMHVEITAEVEWKTPTGKYIIVNLKKNCLTIKNQITDVFFKEGDAILYDNRFYRIKTVDTLKYVNSGLYVPSVGLDIEAIKNHKKLTV